MGTKIKQQVEKAVLTGREKSLICVSALCVIVAIAAVAFSFVSAVPSDAAAKVNDSYLSEQRVSDWISEYRGTYGLSDDDTFASYLSSQSLTVTEYRINTINQIVTNDLVQKRADELGITVSDDEVQAEYDSVVNTISSGDNSLFQSTIEGMGLTETSLKARYRNNLLQEKLLQADVPVETPSDSDLLSYVTSNLSGTTQMHVYRVVFNGTDKETKSQQCNEALKAESDAGTLTAEKFAEIAKQYSDEEDVATTGGSLGWTGSGVIPSEISDSLETMSKGELTSVLAVEDDGGAYEIAYVDDEYTFPEAGSFSSLSDLNMPSELKDVVSTATALATWQSKCSSYLVDLLAKAKITYYAVPDNASYNVSVG